MTRQLQAPLAPVECAARALPPHNPGTKIQMTQRDAVEFEALGQVEILGEIHWHDDEEEQDEEVIDVDA